ncbi:MAG: trypsin-like peptidase domain-containing protein [Rhodospirillaceae bacterium]
MDENIQRNCALGLIKYLFALAALAVATLAGTSWFISRDALAQTSTAEASRTTGEPAPVSLPIAVGSETTTVQPAVVRAAPSGNTSNFSAIVTGLHGTVVSIGRSRMRNRFDTNGAAERPQTVAPGTEGTLQFAAPAVGAVLEAVGTGFIVRSDGYILTNYHVVRGNDSMVVTVVGETQAQNYNSNIVKLDAAMDLALLKIEPRVPLRVAPLGDSDRTQVADEVIAIGSPFGLDLSVSRGIISAKRKALVIEGTVHRDLIQTDAAINQGNSGGPLINRSGEVIGVNTAIYTPTGAFAGVGFAVPSNQAKLFLADVIAIQASHPAGTSGLAPWSLPVAMPPGGGGAAGPPIPADAASPHGDSRDSMDCAICHQLLARPGAPSAFVGRSSQWPSANPALSIPAAAATGIPRSGAAGPPIPAGSASPHGDNRDTMDCATCHRLLPRPGVPTVGVVGQPAWPQGNSARGIPVAAPPPGGAMAAPAIIAGTPAPHNDGRETMDCAICHKFISPVRGATVAQLAQGPLQFARPPASLALNAAAMSQLGTPSARIPTLGATVQAVTADLARQTGQTEGKGVFVSRVVPGSPAAAAGLQPGMVIEKVDGRRLRSPSDLAAVVAAAKTGDRLRLAVSGNNGRQELRLLLTAPMPAPSTSVPISPVPTEFSWRGMEIETFASVTPIGPVAGAPLKGAVIAEVLPTSPVQRVGLQANDIVLEISGMKTGSAEQLNQALIASADKRSVVLRVSRANREFFIVLP